ncbi:hypothetical protein QF028_002616 [Neobacillus sp. B4I6]
MGKRKIALYVIIPVMDSTWEGLINLFFNQMFQELYKVGAKNRAKLPHPVVFILDEFPNLGKFPDYERFLATCRGYGIGVLTIVQNITQLQERYGREQAESILGNCGTKICLGNVNETTAKYFSQLMGKTTAKVETGSSSESKGKSSSSSSSSSYSYAARNLMNEDEILTMHKDDCIIIITGKHPIKAKKAYQYLLFPNVSTLHFQGAALLILLAVFAVAFIAFLFSVAVFHADIMFLYLLSPLACVSVIADDNEYLGVWWRELLSQIVTIIAKIFLFVVALSILINENITFLNFLLLMGCCILLIKSPSVLRSMWYSTGSGRGMMGAMGGTTKLVARRFLLKR